MGRTEGGPRHFLDGRPVHAGTTLELMLADGRWVRIRYEWGWQADAPPTAHLPLGIPESAEKLADPTSVSFDLPARAILRWPAAESH